MDNISTLYPKYCLHGNAYTYHIEKVLGQGSFGITYLASTTIIVAGTLGNIETKVQVAIKEFFMKDFNERYEDGSIIETTKQTIVNNYLGKFHNEAIHLAKLAHDNIVKVLEVFEANNTCYYAMQYIPGGNLDEYVKERGGLPEKEAIDCIRQIASAIDYMHEHKMLHLDLKPSNVMLNDNKYILIDFGLSKQYTSEGDPESSTTIGLGTPGYAPIEQSNCQEKDFSPTLDVYALGATFFKLLTGKTPPKSSDILNEGLQVEILRQKGVTNASIHLIEVAMEPKKLKRLKTAKEFLSFLSDEATNVNTISTEHISISVEEGTIYQLKSKIALPISGNVNWKSSNLDIVSVDKNGKLTAKKPGESIIIASGDGVELNFNVTVTARNIIKQKSSNNKFNFKWLIVFLAIVLVSIGFICYFNKIPRTVWPMVTNLFDTVASVRDLVRDSTTLVDTIETDSTEVISELHDVPISKSQLTDNLEKGQPLKITEISLNHKTLELFVGDTVKLKLKYKPSNISNKHPIWQTDNRKIATVSSGGTITAIKPGKTTIIVSCDGIQEYCKVTVKEQNAPNNTTEISHDTNKQSSKQGAQQITSSIISTINNSSENADHTSEQNHQYVDLGLPSGMLWATCNVGASSPYEYGMYFAWGETSTKNDYDWPTLKYDISGSGNQFLKYVNSSDWGIVDNKLFLEMSDDAARVNWGGRWRTPTREECSELCSNCYARWQEMGGHQGLLFTSKINGNSIFLPAAGCRKGASLTDSNVMGYYWSSSAHAEYSYFAYCFCFNSKGGGVSDKVYRCTGRTIRPVMSSPH